MAKARRRAGISMLIMLIGFMAVVLVVVYRLSTMGSSADAAYQLESVSIPAGAELVSAQADGGMVTVTYRTDDASTIRIYDGKTGEMVREIAVVAE